RVEIRLDVSRAAGAGAAGAASSTGAVGSARGSPSAAASAMTGGPASMIGGWGCDCAGPGAGVATSWAVPRGSAGTRVGLVLVGGVSSGFDVRSARSRNGGWAGPGVSMGAGVGDAGGVVATTAG